MNLGQAITWTELNCNAESVARLRSRSVAATLLAEVERLRQVTRNVYEVWAGSEGIPMPETAAEAYLLQLVEQMRDEAKNGLTNDQAKGAGGGLIAGGRAWNGGLDMDWREKERIYIEKLNSQMREIEMLRSFIAKARANSTLLEQGKSFSVIVPYWFMRDDAISNV